MRGCISPRYGGSMTMTEYDYSPEAYERYLSTQQRISRWVDHTQQQPPANPFVPSVTSESRSSGGHYSSHSGSSSRRHDHRSSSHSNSHASSRDYTADARSSSHSHRPTVTRTNTSPHSHSTHVSSSHTSSHRSRHSSSQRRSSSLSPSSSLSSSRTLPYSTVHPDPMSPTVIEPSYSQPIVVPINGGQGGYVIVPPRGRKLDIIDLNKNYDPEEHSRSVFKKMWTRLSS